MLTDNLCQPRGEGLVEDLRPVRLEAHAYGHKDQLPLVGAFADAARLFEPPDPMNEQSALAAASWCGKHAPRGARLIVKPAVETVQIPITTAEGDHSRPYFGNQILLKEGTGLPTKRGRSSGRAAVYDDVASRP